MNNRINKSDEIAKYIGYLKERNIEILSPDVNNCEVLFSTDGKSVRLGLLSIKGVGADAAALVVHERRKNGPYKSLQNLFERLDNLPNKTMIEGLIKAGSLDAFGETRATLLNNYERVLSAVIQDRKKSATGQMSLFDSCAIDDFSPEVELIRVDELPKQKILEYEKEVLNTYMSGHPLNDYAAMYNDIPFKLGQLAEEIISEDENQEEKIAQDVGQYDGKFVTIAGMLNSVTKKTNKRGDDMALARLEDLEGGIELFVFGNSYSKNKDMLVKNKIVKVEGILKYRDGVYSLSVQKIEPWVQKNNSDENDLNYVLLIIIDDLKSKEYEDACEIFNAYPGGMDVILRSNGRHFKLQSTVKNSNALLCELQAVLGSDSAMIIEKKK